MREVNDQFPTPGKPKSMKAFAVFLHLEFDASFRSIGKCLKVSTVTVMGWVKEGAESLQMPEIPSSKGAKIMLFDEMWHFVDGKKQDLDLEGVRSAGKKNYCSENWQA
ncbi:MAG: hypothetical protein LBT03_01135 [Holosporales bacterium]|jgi:hypothetical protein|nr:hypothetical protein [Holosporales bacterium]